MNYITITSPDVNNGKGCRATIWVAGCSHNCKGCHNVFAQNYNIGKPLMTCFDKLDNIINKSYMQGITISGGDPLDQSENSLKELMYFLYEFKDKYPKKDIWIYTGYTISELKDKHSQYIDEILNIIDVLVDGPYIEEKRDLTLPFRGSSNQNIIHLKENHKDH